MTTPDQRGLGYIAELTEGQQSTLEGIRARAEAKAELDPNAPPILPPPPPIHSMVSPRGNAARKRIGAGKAAERRGQRQQIARRQAGTASHRKAAPTRRKKAS